MKNRFREIYFLATNYFIKFLANEEEGLSRRKKGKDIISVSVRLKEMVTTRALEGTFDPSINSRAAGNIAG